MGKVYRYPENRSRHWRKRTNARRYRARWLSRTWIKLALLALAAVGAMVSQLTEGLPATVANWFRPTPGPMTGVASVIDGDTIEIHGQRIRFNGIDAPESKQYCADAKGFEYACGRDAANALDGFLATSRPVQCTFVSWDSYGRYVGDCKRADGTSVAAWMVEHGQALDWPKYSGGAYAEQQAKAKAAKIGLWIGTFQAPWEWRLDHGDKPWSQASRPLGIVGRQVAQSYSCQPRLTCSQISSCDEANWYLANCPWGGKLDRDNDGIPCETLC
ncbi:thermonuclease family protein [Mesorhizobium sp. M4A.F.Ca.ET.022.05.2.1]|uniref:thermonuclease family protein n=1 Tax=Mesorhizobium sp. M4A.F.Ca.ET.022.05.2.1 TaxID=2496653 RepID=UPI001FDF01FD|nr:thermonuclease family protein [Mesorhizobium sp. M4A.F.Ca.ET.022.05.2.1]